MSGYSLNEKQEAAAGHFEGPMMVLAGPGSGKTTVIVRRIVNLIEKHGAAPHNILVITFTKAAAVEMKERFFAYCRAADKNRVFISTFHSLFFTIITKHYNYDMDCVLAEEERTGIIRNIAAKHDAPLDNETVRALISEMGFIKSELIPPEEYHSPEISDELFLKIYQSYENYKNRNGKIDFDDMMQKCHELFKENAQALNAWRSRFVHILIDEFQDINKIQYELVKMLAYPRNNLFIVGDDDQSIYRFRGARPDFLLNFPKDFPDTANAVLDINYRSTDNIIELCNHIISANTVRYGKEMTGTGQKGEPPRVIKTTDTETEAMAIAERVLRFSEKCEYTEMAVVYRVNIQSRAFIDAFVNKNIPFTIKDETPSIYEHWVCRDIVAYMTLAGDKSRSEEAARIINKPSRYINAAYVKEAKRAKNAHFIQALLRNRRLKDYQRLRITELLHMLDGVNRRKPYDAMRYIRGIVGYDEYIKHYCQYRKIRPQGLFEVLDELTEGTKCFESIPEYLAHIELSREAANKKTARHEKKPKGVTLSTMHGVKGLEFDIVFIAGAVEGLIPHEKSVSPADIEEERRLLYVGATRARRLLYVSVIENRYENKVEPTIFLPLLNSVFYVIFFLHNQLFCGSVSWIWELFSF